MHSHPDGVAIYLSKGSMVFHFPDGKTQNATGKAGQALYTPAVVHDPENTGDKPFDAIVIEIKSGAAGTNASKKRVAVSTPSEGRTASIAALSL